MSSLSISRQRSLYQSFDPGALKSQQAQIAQLREQMASGKRVGRPSDDPTAFGQARRLEQLSNRYESHLRTIDSARSWVNHTEQALDHLVEVFTQASEEAVRASSAGRSDADREAIAGRLESLIAETVDTMNTRVGDAYIFAGNRTGVRPFDDDGAPTANAAAIGGARIRDIGPGSSIQINISGEQLNDVGPGLAATLQNLVDAIRSHDPDAMQGAMGDVEDARLHVVGLVTVTGNRAHRLTLAEGNLRDAGLLAESRRSELEDTDLLDAMLALQQAETGLHAALQVTARTLQTSILDYIR